MVVNPHADIFAAFHASVRKPECICLFVELKINFVVCLINCYDGHLVAPFHVFGDSVVWKLQQDEQIDKLVIIELHCPDLLPDPLTCAVISAPQIIQCDPLFLPALSDLCYQVAAGI